MYVKGVSMCPDFLDLLKLLAIERKSKLSFTPDAVLVGARGVGFVRYYSWWDNGPADWWAAFRWSKFGHHIIRPEDPDMFDKLEEFFLCP